MRARFFSPRASRAVSIGAMALLAGCVSRPRDSRLRYADSGSEKFGVLVMAHGGSKRWNEEVLATVAPLKERYNVEVAFGMADPATMQASVKQLEARGAERIGVVRLFISGESFLERTQQILGVIPGAPAPPANAADNAHADHDGEHDMALWKIDTRAAFVLSKQGLVEAPEMGEVLAGRATALSHDPSHEDVLIIAHGPRDDAENDRWLAELEERADVVRHAAPFRTVQVETLREDWPDKRVAAEARIREFVAHAKANGSKAIVIPFRVQGFGPYGKVLEGLDYVSDARGLIPHPSVTAWIEHQVEELRVER
jgi:sirohydrochlorin cobaltochelatase